MLVKYLRASKKKTFVSPGPGRNGVQAEEVYRLLSLQRRIFSSKDQAGQARHQEVLLLFVPPFFLLKKTFSFLGNQEKNFQ